MNVNTYEEASDWIVRHRDGGLDDHDRKLFDEWLRESPQHVRAYLEMSSIWEDVPSLDASRNPSADELIARARADDNVVPLSSLAQSASTSRSGIERAEEPVVSGPGRETTSCVREASTPVPLRPKGKDGLRAGRMRLYGLAATVLIAVGSGWFYLHRGVYITETGEQRSLALADGSTVELNSHSRIRVQYTEDERRVSLVDVEGCANGAHTSVARLDNEGPRLVLGHMEERLAF